MTLNRFWATGCKTIRPICYRSVVLFVCLSCRSVCDIGVLWPNGWRIKVKPGMQVGLGPCDIVLDGDPAAPPKRGTDPTLRPMSIVAKQLDGSRCSLVRR